MENKKITDRDLLYKIHSFVGILVENEESWESLKHRYPEILADLVSARVSPNCSCRNRVGSFLNEKYLSSDQEKEYILKLFEIPKINENANKLLNEIKSKEDFQKNFPRIHNVKKGETAWKEFVEYLNKNNFDFRGFSLVDNGQDVTVYFI